MYAPVVTRFITYGIDLDPVCQKYCQHIMATPLMKEWREAAQAEPDDIEELEVEF
jgi:glutathione S-transferase